MTTRAVFVGQVTQTPCTTTVTALTVSIVERSTLGVVPPGQPTTLNGLPAIIDRPSNTAGPTSGTMTAFLPDQAVLVQITPASAADLSLADQIAATVGLAAIPESFPQAPPHWPTTTVPAPSPFCAAVKVLQQQAPKVIEPNGQDLALPALPFVQRMYATAPAAIRGPLAVIIAWLKAGSPQPTPQSVKTAEGDSTMSWFHLCN